VYHHWQYRPANTSQQFLTTDRIPIEITGGRKKGYRGYTVKQRLNSGEWQVDVETGDGQIIGRIAFQVEKKEDDAHEVVSMIY
jgi:hypothetical protein